jgi:hypothetical protein
MGGSLSRRIGDVNSAPILTSPWPQDLDPAAVPFTKRTATILQRQGLYEKTRFFSTK